MTETTPSGTFLEPYEMATWALATRFVERPVSRVTVALSRRWAPCMHWNIVNLSHLDIKNGRLWNVACIHVIASVWTVIALSPSFVYTTEAGFMRLWQWWWQYQHPSGEHLLSDCQIRIPNKNIVFCLMFFHSYVCDKCQSDIVEWNGGMEYGMDGECTQNSYKSCNWHTARNYTYILQLGLLPHCKGFMRKSLLT